MELKGKKGAEIPHGMMTFMRYKNMLHAFMAHPMRGCGGQREGERKVIPVQPTKQLKYATASSTVPPQMCGRAACAHHLHVHKKIPAPYRIPRKRTPRIRNKKKWLSAFFPSFFIPLLRLYLCIKSFAGVCRECCKNPVRITHPPRVTQLASCS